MNSTELRDIIASAEFQQDLGELSSYLASIMQERPIVYLVAKHLWKRGCKFALEDSRRDLYVNKKRVEFKFNFDRVGERLKDELSQYGGDLRGMWASVV